MNEKRIIHRWTNYKLDKAYHEALGDNVGGEIIRAELALVSLMRACQDCRISKEYEKRRGEDQLGLPK